MVRTLHRTRIARLLVTLVVVLTVSPVTAPFTVVSLCELHHKAADQSHRHPGTEMAEAHAKVTPHIVVPAPCLLALMRAVWVERGSLTAPAAPAPAPGHGPSLVLRV